jgi:erythronate-4-phosphate dehydrogenase
MKIIADVHIPYVKNYFGHVDQLILKPGRSITHDVVDEADMLLVRSVTPVNAKLLQDTPVRFVGSVTAGMDHLDTAWLDQAGISWYAACGFNAPPVADYVVSVVAALQMQSLLKTSGLTAAVIGVGEVGSRVVTRLQQLGVEVRCCDPLRASQSPDFVHHPLETIADVDLVCLHVPLSRDGAAPTYHFIDEAFLKRQRPGCVLLNASRGAVIDSAALMQYGQHLQWCFDVWEREPYIDQRILSKATLATPHIAGYSVQSKQRGAKMIYEIACAKQYISPAPTVPVIADQKKILSGAFQTWQEVVLGVFNPLPLTGIMQTILPASLRYGEDFDNMRHHFHDRYEFDYVEVRSDALSAEDCAQLARLQFIISNSPL